MLNASLASLVKTLWHHSLAQMAWILIDILFVIIYFIYLFYLLFYLFIIYFNQLWL